MPFLVSFGLFWSPLFYITRTVLSSRTNKKPEEEELRPEEEMGLNKNKTSSNAFFIPIYTHYRYTESGFKTISPFFFQKKIRQMDDLYAVFYTCIHAVERDHIFGIVVADLHQILKHFQKNGFKVVPISEIILTGEYYMDHTGKQCSVE